MHTIVRESLDVLAPKSTKEIDNALRQFKNADVRDLFKDLIKNGVKIDTSSENFKVFNTGPVTHKLHRIKKGYDILVDKGFKITKFFYYFADFAFETMGYDIIVNNVVSALSFPKESDAKKIVNDINNKGFLIKAYYIAGHRSFQLNNLLKK